MGGSPTSVSSSPRQHPLTGVLLQDLIPRIYTGAEQDRPCRLQAAICDLQRNRSSSDVLRASQRCVLRVVQVLSTPGQIGNAPPCRIGGVTREVDLHGLAEISNNKEHTMASRYLLSFRRARTCSRVESGTTKSQALALAPGSGRSHLPGEAKLARQQRH